MSNYKRIKILILLALDIIAILIAYTFSFYVKTDELVTNIYWGNAIITVIIYLVPMFLFKMYRSLWRFAGIEEFVKVIYAISIGLVLNIIYSLIVKSHIPIIITILSGILIFVLIVGVRLAYRILDEIRNSRKYFKNKNIEKILLIGAGSAGRVIIDEIEHDRNSNMKVIGIIDDNSNKWSTYFKGIKVYGGRNKIKEFISNYDVDKIFITIPTLSLEDKKEIVNICNETKVKVKIMPGVCSFMSKEVNIKSMRDIDLHDLLGRDEVVLNKDGIKDYIHDKIILVTGGGGSIGSELCRQIAGYKPKLLIMFDIYENNVYEIQNELKMEYPELNQIALIGSVREKWRLEDVFKKYSPQVIFHAAAHKHVPLMEVSPLEAIKNNVRGTFNTAELAYKYGVERFILISTDKAVNPTNVMGATKRYCEMIIQGMQKKAQDTNSKSEFVAVRFGNVLGSNGSVIPLFKNQIKKGGPITLTHKDITRYFMLIPEAAQLVLQAGVFASGGEIFVLDMGEPVKIYDLAEKLIKLSGFEPHTEIKIKEVGLRPGEKLYEELLMNEEGLTETKHNKIFIAKPSEYDVDVLKDNLYELIKIGEEQGNEALMLRLHDFVPTYVRVN